MDTKARPVILFDGVCNLCNGAVQFIIKRDREAVFAFASLQSEAGLKLLQEYGVPADSDSFVLIAGPDFYLHSDAALRVASRLKMPWKTAGIFYILPRILRDRVYKLIARNRYRWFGKQNECMIPRPEWKERFL
ncbi:thiol-disulfide oxidoreductase DCC family protein [Peribacillus sp. SCS-26]|uniref:thiol-disulfide oxidoreductase DCC family protein n=1 Tax=Paraperibacillus marinus TaxID=3115295 RepID=UPI0039068B8B